MPHINLFFFVLSALKNINVSIAMLQFFALLKQEITSVSNTAFCNPIGITARVQLYVKGNKLQGTNKIASQNKGPTFPQGL